MALMVNSVTFDAGDPGALARFWAGVFGVEADSPNPYVAFVRPPGQQLMFIHVDEPKTAKNRCHLDLHAETQAEVDAEVDRLGALGAALVGRHAEHGVYWATFRDPEGNEFCVGTPLAGHGH